MSAWQPATARCPRCQTWWRTVVRMSLGLPWLWCPACGEQRWRAQAPGGHTQERS